MCGSVHKGGARLAHVERSGADLHRGGPRHGRAGAAGVNVDGARRTPRRRPKISNFGHSRRDRHTAEGDKPSKRKPASTSSGFMIGRHSGKCPPCSCVVHRLLTFDYLSLPSVSRGEQSPDHGYWPPTVSSPNAQPVAVLIVIDAEIDQARPPWNTLPMLRILIWMPKHLGIGWMMRRSRALLNGRFMVFGFPDAAIYQRDRGGSGLRGGCQQHYRCGVSRDRFIEGRMGHLPPPGDPM